MCKYFSSDLQEVILIMKWLSLAGDKHFVTPPASSPFSAIKQPKLLHSPMGEKFESGVKNKLLHCDDETSSNDFEVPQYPIEEKQNKQHMEREMSIK